MISKIHPSFQGFVKSGEQLINTDNITRITKNTGNGDEFVTIRMSGDDENVKIRSSFIDFELAVLNSLRYPTEIIDIKNIYG